MKKRINLQDVEEYRKLNIRKSTLERIQVSIWTYFQKNR